MLDQAKLISHHLAHQFLESLGNVTTLKPTQNTEYQASRQWLSFVKVFEMYNN